MDRVVCETCPRSCALAEGQLGACKARGNVGGEVGCLNYGRVTSLALDPVEKKPLSRWKSGSFVLSVGSYGCNLSCPFCQNHEISQVGEGAVPWRYVSPEDLLVRALELRDSRCVGLAFTYNEPLVGWEYVRDCAALAHDAALDNVLVTNGAVSTKVFSQLLPLIDAVNVDLKAFNTGFYQACGSADAFDCVKGNIQAAAALGTCHVEVTTLFVPGMSDAQDVLDAAAWIARLDRSIPYHLSQYHPAFRMESRPVPDDDLRVLAGRIGDMLDTVVLGNIW